MTISQNTSGRRSNAAIDERGQRIMRRVRRRIRFARQAA